MKRDEHLMAILGEEAVEVAHRASKMLRFGRQEVEPKQTRTNEERLFDEMCDLIAVYKMLGLPTLKSDAAAVKMFEKKNKVEKFLAYSKECGTLEDEREIWTCRCSARNLGPGNICASCHDVRTKK